MGDCCSRSNKNDIESHKLKKNKKNDRYFIKVPLKNDEISLESFSTAKLEKKILNLETKKKLFADRYSSLIDSKTLSMSLLLRYKKELIFIEEAALKKKTCLLESALSRKDRILIRFHQNLCCLSGFLSSKSSKVFQNLKKSNFLCCSTTKTQKQAF